MIKKILKAIIRKLAPVVLSSPLLKKAARAVLAPFPRLAFRLRRGAGFDDQGEAEAVVVDPDDLSLRAHCIYEALIKVRKRRAANENRH